MCPPEDECINKLWQNHTVEYYSATKKEVLIHASTLINLENDMPRIQTQKVMYYMIPFLWYIQNRQIPKGKKHIRDYQGLGVGNGEWLYNGQWFVFLGWWKCFEIRGGRYYHYVYTKCHWIVHFIRLVVCYVNCTSKESQQKRTYLRNNKCCKTESASYQYIGEIPFSSIYPT